MCGKAGQNYERGLERLKVCELLLRQAADKRRHGELMEALELRAEAFAFSREGSAMLEQAAKDRAADHEGDGATDVRANDRELTPALPRVHVEPAGER